MIWECMEVFEKLLKEKKNLVIENYVPKDGDYYLVHMAEEKWEIETPVSVFYDKKKGVVVGETDIRYDKICFLDYCSKLLDMNKPIDSKKIIHSNNYLSFFIKKESLFNGKLTQKIIDVLSNLRRSLFKVQEREKQGVVSGNRGALRKNR